MVVTRAQTKAVVQPSQPVQLRALKYSCEPGEFAKKGAEHPGTGSDELFYTAFPIEKKNV